MTAHAFPASHRRALVATLITLAASTACGSSAGVEGTDATSATPTSETPVATTTPSSEAEVAPIEGTWSTATLQRAAFRKALPKQGLGAHSEAFVSELGTTVELTLEIGAGFWTLYAGMDDAARTVTDRGTYELKGKRVLVRPNSGGENLFGWHIDGEELALELVSTTEPPYDGVPAETYQRGFYTTSEFIRETS